MPEDATNNNVHLQTSQHEHPNHNHHPDERDDSSSSMSTSVAAPPPPEDQKLDAVVAVQWPCANCHAMVSEDRCPYCHGIQVKIKSDEAVARTLPEAWIERVSPTTIRGGTPLFSRQAQAVEEIVDMDDNELVEIDEDDEEELEQQNSEGSPGTRQHYENNVEEEFGDLRRPNNPVAFLLATTAVAESPLPKFASPQRTPDAAMDDDNDSATTTEHRQDLKKKMKSSRDSRMEEGDNNNSPGKKQRILFAM